MKYSILFITALATSLVAPNLSRAQLNEAGSAPRPHPVYDAALDALEKEAAARDLAAVPPKPAGATLAIPKDGADVQDLANTEEDLNVMGRILAKAAAGGGDQAHNAMGITIRNSIFGASASPQNLYLEGYGALFFLNVNYPLVGPPAKSPDSASKDATSSEWEDARRELYQPRVPGLALNWSDSTSYLGASEPYDADKVEQLKADLTAALKNAVHIRKLKSDETVTVVVAGRSGGTTAKTVHTRSSGSRSTTATVIATAPRGDTQKSQLILRAKRSDIEAFQKDKLSLDEFRKRVTLMLH